MGAERYAQAVSPDHENRDANDFYPTPRSAIKSLLAIEAFGKQVWEPACGDGAISKVLEEHGYLVDSSDLVDRGYGAAGVDFLMEHKLRAPDIITNPPFKLAEEFVQHSLDLGAEKVAMLLRLAWLEGVERKRLFDRTPLARVHVSSRRLTFARGEALDLGAGGGGMIAFAWFVWDRRCRIVGGPSLSFFDWMEYAPECAKKKTAAPAEPMPLFE